MSNFKILNVLFLFQDSLHFVTQSLLIGEVKLIFANKQLISKTCCSILDDGSHQRIPQRIGIVGAMLSNLHNHSKDDGHKEEYYQRHTYLATRILIGHLKEVEAI